MWLNVLLTLTLLFAVGDKFPELNDECLYQGDLTRVYKAPKLYWYGLDLSKVKLVEEKRLPWNGIIARNYGKGWIKYFEEAYSDKLLKVIFKNTELIMAADSFAIHRYAQCDTAHIVSVVPGLITLDTIKTVIKSYKLAETEGVGVSVIVSNMVKESNAAFCYTTCFDIKTLEPIWVCKTVGYGDGYGLRDYWGWAMYKGFDQFTYGFYDNKKYKIK